MNLERGEDRNVVHCNWDESSGEEKDNKSLQKSSVTGCLFQGSDKADLLLCRFMVYALTF